MIRVKFYEAPDGKVIAECLDYPGIFGKGSDGIGAYGDAWDKVEKSIKSDETKERGC